MKLLRRFLILSHRYLGIALSALIVMWFATGIAMMYVGGMPRLTPELRLERLPNVDLSRVRLTPAEALERGNVDPNLGRVVLLTVMDRPAYRFGAREPVTVFADDGQVLEDVSVAQSKTIASRFMNLPEAQINFQRTLTDVDQWTLLQGRQLPLHKFRVDDASATELYVSPATGEVSVLTTRRSRGFAWISTIPHWLYFTALRTNQAAWYRAVVWTSGLACVLAVLGLVLSVTQFRRQKPFAASIPYSGWMRWHYVTGVVFGVFTLTWAFSGMLSMEPFAWTNATGLEVSRDVFTGGPADLSKFPAMDPATWDRVLGGRGIKEVDFARIQDEHYYVVRAARAEAAVAGRFERAPYDRLLEMVRLNCVTVTALSRLFLPAMRARGRGAMIIVASAAGYQPIAFAAAYGATKAFDLLLAEALWAENRGNGVDVLAVSPGPVDTEFQVVAGESPHPGAKPEEVVRAAFAVLGRKPSVVVGTGNKIRAWSVRLAPRGLVARVAGRVMRANVPAEAR